MTTNTEAGDQALASPPASAAKNLVPKGWEFRRVEDEGIYVRPPTFSTGAVVTMRSARRETVMLWSLVDDLLLAHGCTELTGTGLPAAGEISKVRAAMQSLHTAVRRIQSEQPTRHLLSPTADAEITRLLALLGEHCDD